MFLATVKYFILITLELSVLFLGISTLVAFVLAYLSQEKIRSWFSKKGLLGNVLGAAVGAVTPFCSCSTIPMTLGLLNAGSPFGAVMSFVIASPLLNPIILTMIATLMGLKASLVYFASTFLASIIFGVMLEKFGGADLVKSVRIKGGQTVSTGTAGPVVWRERLKAAFYSALGDFRAVLPYLLIGVAIGAAIYGYVPQDFVARIAGPQNPFAIPVAAAIGVPLYIRAETAIPIGLALAQKGMSLGAVIALIIGGAGMSIPEMAMLASIFKKKLVAAIAAVIWLTAVISGYLFMFVA